MFLFLLLCWKLVGSPNHIISLFIISKWERQRWKGWVLGEGDGPYTCPGREVWHALCPEKLHLTDLYCGPLSWFVLSRQAFSFSLTVCVLEAAILRTGGWNSLCRLLQAENIIRICPWLSAIYHLFSFQKYSWWMIYFPLIIHITDSAHNLSCTSL